MQYLNRYQELEREIDDHPSNFLYSMNYEYYVGICNYFKVMVFPIYHYLQDVVFDQRFLMRIELLKNYHQKLKKKNLNKMEECIVMFASYQLIHNSKWNTLKECKNLKKRCYTNL